MLAAKKETRELEKHPKREKLGTEFHSQWMRGGGEGECRLVRWRDSKAKWLK